MNDLSPKGLDAALAAVPHATPLATTVRHYPILLGLEGPLQGHRFILNKQMVTVGRDMLADIVLRDNKAARVHARVTYANIAQRDEAPLCRVYDAGSETGTFVNQLQVPVSGQLLADQDHIQVGKTIFGFYIRDDEQTQGDQHQPLDIAVNNDPETGLLQHRVFERIYPREFERARRYRRDLSLMLIAVENLAQIKDQYGSPARIMVLRRVGQILQKSFRSSDVVARHDAADVIALLPETPLDNALIAAQRIIQKTQKLAFPVGDILLEIQINIGLSAIQRDLFSGEDVLHRCEKSLQIAREHGVNEVYALDLEAPDEKQ